MTISNTIQDRHTASLAWLYRKLMSDEATLPDYDRPLKVIKDKGRSPFETNVARYGFSKSVIKYLLP